MSHRSRMAAATVVALGCSLSVFAALFRTSAFLGPLLGTMLLAVAGGEIVRLLRWPALLGPPLSAALCLGWVTLRYAPGHARLDILPTWRSLARLSAVAHQGFAGLRRYATPVPDTHGLVLLCCAGIFAVALVTYLLAATMSRPAAAGLPLLALYATGAAVSRQGLGAVPFLLGAAGYLLLLGADARDRLVRWGRLVNPEGRDEARRPFVGGRIGLAAVTVGLLLPLLLPVLHAHRLTGGRHGGGGSGPGGCDCPGTEVTYAALIRVGQSLTEQPNTQLFEVTSSDPVPQYLQLTTLDTYTAGSWTGSHPLTGPLLSRGPVRLPGGLTGHRVLDRIHLEGALDDRWLPVPEPVQQVQVAGDWRYDGASGTVFSPDTATTDLSEYKVVSLDEQPPVAALSAPPPRVSGWLRRDVQLPANLPPLIRRLADQITAGHTSEYGKALALQQYFRDGTFRYSTTDVPDQNGERALVAFLHRRTGYCVQFAATMAVMARAVGLPARVAVGFTGGSRRGPHTWLVSTHDAHAWPELYFPGAGWLRFEPTPGGAGDATVPAYARYTRGGGTGGRLGPHNGAGVNTPAPTPTTGLRSRLRTPTRAAAAGHRRAPGGPGGPGLPAGGGTAGRTVLLALAVALLLAGSPALIRAGLRRRRLGARSEWRRVEGAWAEVLQTARDLALRVPAGATPRRAAGALADAARLEHAPREQLLLLVGAVERVRYGPPGARSAARVDLRRPVSRVRAALFAAARPRRRWLARLAPPSLGDAAGAAVAALSDALGRLTGRGLARARKAVRGRAGGRQTVGGPPSEPEPSRQPSGPQSRPVERLDVGG